MDKPKCFGSYDAIGKKVPCRRCNFWEPCKFKSEAPVKEKPKRTRKPKTEPVVITEDAE